MGCNEITTKIQIYGEGFEMAVYNAVHNYDVLCIPHFKCYSHRLKRPTEIDLLVITPYRIMCVEAKKVSTYIKGELNDKIWISTSGRHRMKRENPVMQNYNHIRCIKNNLAILNLPNLEIDNIVCVPSRCSRQTSCKEVYNLQELISLIEKDEKFGVKKYRVDFLYKVFNHINDNMKIYKTNVV